MKILEINALTKKYGDFTAVDGADFFIEKGEIFGFLGPNGAGKTTTINMLTGLARSTSGSIFLLGKEYTHRIKKAQHLMGIVPDESNLYDELSGFENLCFCAALYGMDKAGREERARRLLEEFKLTDAAKKPFRAYSKGMKRKLTIAAGIIHEPNILFLDEPTTGIDVTSARQIRSLILELNKKGTTIFLTTHYIEEAERLCHRIAFIVDGKIVRIGATKELLEGMQQENIVQFTLAGNIDLFHVQQAIQNRFPSYIIEAAEKNIFRVRSSYAINIIPLMLFFEKAGAEVYEAKIIRPSLEDVFVKVTGVEIERMKKEKEQKKGAAAAQ